MTFSGRQAYDRFYLEYVNSDKTVIATSDIFAVGPGMGLRVMNSSPDTATVEVIQWFGTPSSLEGAFVALLDDERTGETSQSYSQRQDLTSNWTQRDSVFTQTLTFRLPKLAAGLNPEFRLFIRPCRSVWSLFSPDYILVDSHRAIFQLRETTADG